MNIYDFDGTIYDGDSSIDFCLYCFKRKPYLIKYLPRIINAFILYKFKRIKKKEMKERFFSFFKDIDIKALVISFWDKHDHKIYDYYLRQKRADDIIISASPEFLLQEISRRLDIKYLIASKVDFRSGKFEGENCWGEEKVKRLKEEYNIESCDNFYSDSTSDTPLANIANRAYLIKNGKIIDWVK